MSSSSINKWGYIDTAGTIVAPFIYDNEAHFNDDMAGIMVQGKGWGYIDITGKEVIRPQFDFIFNFNEGFSVVEKDDIFFIINKKGHCVINCPEIK